MNDSLMSYSKPIPIVTGILQVDNGQFHKGKNLLLPENIILRHLSGGILSPENAVLFQPPYCPELNPIERLWEHLKADLKWASFKTLAQLQTTVAQLLSELTPKIVASVTGYPFILDALSALNAI